MGNVRVVEHVPQDGCSSKYEPQMVCQARTALCVSKNESKDVIETALVRQTYAGWCGGTAAFAASYPISPVRVPCLFGTQCGVCMKSNGQNPEARSFEETMTVFEGV